MPAERGATPEIIGLEDEYEIIAELGRGGSAVVYRARDRTLGRDVAIKVVRVPHARVDDEQLARLTREARTVAQLDHPRIVSVYAVRQLPDGLALVMQWIPGRTLKQRIIEEGPLPVPLALSVLRDVAGALGAAHQRGVVHRDVKPENIFLDAYRGTAMLSDFGIAISTEHDTRLTMTGTAIGTPTYMAPELLDGGQPTPRSDVYALGLVAWEMLTGCQPWSGESLYGVIYHQKHGVLAPVDAYRADVPDTVQYVIERALQKRPAARWAGGDGMLAQLEGSVLPADWTAWQAAHARRLAERAQRPAQLTPADSLRDVDRSAQATRRFRRGKASAAPATVPMSATPRSEGQTGGLDTDGDVYAEVREVTPDDAPDWVIEDAALQRAADDEDNVARRVWPWAVAAAGAMAAAVVLLTTDDLHPRRTADAFGIAGDPPPADSRATEVPVMSTPPQRLLPRVGAQGIAGAVDSTTRAEGGVTAASDSTTNARVAEAVGEADGELTDWPDEVDARPVTPAPRVRRAPVAPAPARAPRENAVRDRVAIDAETPALPTRVSVVGAHTLAAGGRHTCLISAGRLRCWGANEDGQLGNGSADTERGVVRVRGDLAFASVSAGLAHTCGVVRGGAVFCWGNGEAGQLGDATTTSRTAPVRVASSLTFGLVRTGREHSCALTDTGTAACWGRNRHGQLGDGTTVGRASPVTVLVASQFRALTLGAEHTCALSVDGAAFCWGANEAGQLGNASLRGRSQPTPVAMSLRFVDIAAGNAHTCAVSVARDVWCWGRVNGTIHSTPMHLPGPARVHSITAGSVHSCARTETGTVWCWGRNEFGQIGNGTTGAYARPQPIGDRRFDAVVANGAHTCARVAADVWCWGYNADRQVAPGAGTEASESATSAEQPTALTRPTRVRDVSGGGT